MQCPVDGCDYESSEHGVKSHCGMVHSVEENPYRVECECNYCGDEFTVIKSQYDNGKGKYCSQECQGLHQTEKGTVECECNYCGDKFTRKKSKYKNRQEKYCSGKCQRLGQRNRVECECNYCGDEFTVTKYGYEEKGRGKYCSKKCLSQDKNVECECNYCGDKFTVTKYAYEQKREGKYCSRKCLSQDKNVECECNYCGNEFTVIKYAYEQKGEGKYCSKKCMGLGMRSANPDIRQSPEYRQFRQTVLERDNHRCVECGDDGDLHVHHIIPIYDDESLATDVDNGKTLCVECHAEVHEELGDPHLAKLIRSDTTKFDIDVTVVAE